MPSAWNKTVKRRGTLKVFNAASAWSVPIAAAVDSFNYFSFGVTLVPVEEEAGANIVIKLAMGAASYKWPGDPWVQPSTLQTNSNFRADSLSGLSVTAMNDKTHDIHFAAIFLPGTLKKATDGQKQVVVMHEFLHAAGLNGITDGAAEPQGGHEDSGIMYPIFSVSGKGLIESTADNKSKPMPPIRLGPFTHCTLSKLWKDATECPVDI